MYQSQYRAASQGAIAYVKGHVQYRGLNTAGILNRDATTPITDFAKWSEQAVLCDPLYDRSADAGFLATWYPRIYPFKPPDVIYRIE